MIRVVVAVLAGLLLISYYAHSMEIDMPPRPAPVANEYLVCCHCRERYASMFCSDCQRGFCSECEPAHKTHVEAV